MISFSRATPTHGLSARSWTFLTTQEQMLVSPRWIVTAKVLSHNGTRFGYFHKQLNVFMFDCIKEVITLSSYPFQFHIDQLAARNSLISRGQKYCSLVGIQNCAYDDEAIMVDKQRIISLSERAINYYPEEDIQIGGRIILDCKTFIEECTADEIRIVEVKMTESSRFTDEDFMLCHYTMMGFSLGEKVWCRFYVDIIQDVTFDDGAFDALLLPTRQKRLIRALAKSHTSGADGFDDLIRGKGQGCIFLLHGEPGIGKTFTAESIADDIKRFLGVGMGRGERGCWCVIWCCRMMRIMRPRSEQARAHYIGNLRALLTWLAT
ncbi:hypothetical protein F5X96DRAFT_613158 [Biscogniauxia mediterranea]|nr:hypothetical protein F5X96DRAFT_613158 [Biscogniauxia mediterranea]